MTDREAPFATISSYYDGLVREHGHSPRACDYGRPESQQAKFETLAKVCDLSGKSVLDVGCGAADFLTFLNARFDNVGYTGIDLSAEMIAMAKGLHPGADISQRNVLDIDAAERFDVVIANGIFYLLGEDAESTMWRIIDHMAALAVRAVAFNSLSTWAPTIEENEFHADPATVLDRCRELSRRVTLHHDYHDRDFTVFVYRNR
ncbi:MAG: methyltransferase domain-containing protein [Alphaproteobacteria bacterium]